MSRHNDPIERLFQGLADQPATGEDWDLPSGNVWQNIESVLTRPGRRHKVVWLVVFGVVILMLVGYGALMYSNGDDKVSESSQLAAGSSQEGEVGSWQSVVGGSEEEGIGSSEAGGVDSPQLAVGSGRVGQVRNLQSSIRSGSVRQVEDFQLGAVNVQREGGNVVDGGAEMRNAQTEVGVLQTGGRVPAMLNPHPASLMFTRDIQSPTNLYRATPARSNRWVLGVFVAPSLGTRRIHVPADRPDLRRALLQNEEESRVGASFGLSAEYLAGNRWSFGIGAEYADYLLNSMYTRQIRYTRAGETINDQGIFENKYKVAIQTSYGRVSTGVVVERDQSTTVPEHTFITLELPVRQSLQMIHFPLYAQYRFTDGYVPLHVRGGITMQLMLRNALDVDGIVERGNTIDRIRTLHDSRIEGARRVTLGYHAALGTDIPLSSRWGLSFEAAINASARPFYRDDELRVFPISANLRVGMQYYLR